MIRYEILVVILFASIGLSAQTPTADFSVGPSACLEQNIDVTNNSLNADLFEWDFCLEDFKTLSSNLDLTTVTSLSGGSGYKIVEDNGSWYGFAVSQFTHSIIRLDFGDSPTNTPSVVDLGNPDGSLLFPQGIDLYKNNGTWYAFVGFNDNNYGLVRLDFGSDLTNPPTGLNLGNFGVTGRFWDLRIVEQGGDLILVIIERNTGSIIRVNYTDSFLNIINISTDVFNSGAIPGAALTPGIDVIKKGSNWFVFLASNSSNAIYQISFGTNILGTATVDAAYGFPGLSKPYRIKVAQEGDNYYAVVTNELAPIDIIDLKDLDVANVPVEILFVGLPQLLSVDVIRYKGKSVVQGVGTLNNKLSELVFEATCGASLSFFEGSDPNPISYNTVGVKNIELKAINSISLEQSIAAHKVTVSALTAPDITFTSQNVCANNDINFTSQNTSGNITDYNWDFGDTNTSMLENPIHQYAVANDYVVSLQVTATNGCNNLAIDTVTIYNQPIADFDLPSASPICTNQNYLFTNTSLFDAGSNPSWEWSANGIPVATTQDLIYAIPAAVMQDIKLKASIPGCENETTKTINTVEDGPLADFTFLDDCEETSIAFTNTTIGTVTGYSWDFGDGNMSNQTSASNTFVDFGNYDVTLQATNAAGCVNSIIKPIQIYSKPQPDFSLDLPPFSCNGSLSQFNDLTPNPVDSNLDSWAWSFGDPQNGTSTSRNPLYTYALAGDYNVNLDVTTNFGCTESVQKMVTITQSPDADFSFDPACVNQATVFSPTSTLNVSSWQWMIGTSTYSQQNPTHVFSSSATFTARLTANGSNGCIAVLAKSVVVPSSPILDFNSVNNCAEQSTIFTDITIPGTDPPVDWTWQFSTLGTGMGSSPSFTFPSSGSYPTVMTVINVSGCSYSISKNVTIIDSPIASFNATPLAGTPPLTVQLSSTSANVVSQLWTINDPDNSTSTEVSPNFTFNELGEYVVDLTVINPEGCSDTSSKIISVIVPSLDIELTSLTPLPAATGETNVLIVLTNKSNSPVSNLKAIIDISGEALISEIIDAVIQPGETYSQVLAIGIVASKSELNYLCVEIVIDGDIDNSNNKKCVNQESAVVIFDPYPNPSTTELNLEWVAATSGAAEIYVFDPTGRKVFENVISDFSVGFNHLAISLSSFNPGIYYVFFVTDNSRKSFPIVVRR